MRSMAGQWHGACKFRPSAARRPRPMASVARIVINDIDRQPARDLRQRDRETLLMTRPCIMVGRFGPVRPPPKGRRKATLDNGRLVRASFSALAETSCKSPRTRTGRHPERSTSVAARKRQWPKAAGRSSPVGCGRTKTGVFGHRAHAKPAGPCGGRDSLLSGSGEARGAQSRIKVSPNPEIGVDLALRSSPAILPHSAYLVSATE